MDKNASLIRIWKEEDIHFVNDHLLIVGDPDGACSKCKEMGINVSTAKTCPECKTEFKYIASRVNSSSKQASRLHSKRPDLTVIDLADVKEVLARDNANKLF
ncbi:MAG: hypothetical protein PHQ52_02790 [Candidatus Omnitrophica bacterium]|nr:hypothetical protein [Candidatus Omnitrophota bacterium]